MQDHFSIVKANSVGNLSPIAKAGSDITVQVGEAVNFDATASFDSDGTIVSYVWSNGLNGVQATLVYDVAGIYVVSLIVTDNDGATAIDDVTVTVNYAQPGGNGDTIPGSGKATDSGSGRLNIILLIALLIMLAVRGKQSAFLPYRDYR